PERLADIRPGEISRAEVAEILGSPTNIAPFDGESWYYVSERTETFAFFEPEVKERQVLVLNFDKSGVLRDMKALSLQDGKEVALVDRETPTAGNDFTVIQQIFGNLGRFEGAK
ncbi:MAG: outer membrane protein assembly factor BamE, partial [Rhodospirillales bacterium]